MSKNSKFSNILDAAKERETTPEVPPKQAVKTTSKVTVKPTKIQAAEKDTKSTKKIGKSRHPDFEQVTTYLRIETHQAAKVALIQEGKGRDFSDLIEVLVADWLKK